MGTMAEDLLDCVEKAALAARVGGVIEALDAMSTLDRHAFREALSVEVVRIQPEWEYDPDDFDEPEDTGR